MPEFGLLDYSPTNIMDGYKRQVSASIEAITKLNPQWVMLQDTFPMQPASGKQYEVRLWESATDEAEVILDPYGPWPLGQADVYTRYALPTPIGLGYPVAELELRRLSEGLQIEDFVNAALTACMMKMHTMIVESLEADVPGPAGKVWSWRSNAGVLTVPIEASPYPNPAALAPPEFIPGEAWSLGLTISKCTYATEELQRNKRQGPFVLFGDIAAMNQLDVDPAYTHADLSLQRAMETQVQRPYGRVSSFVTMAKTPRRVAINAGNGTVPGGQIVQIAYMISLPDMMRYVWKELTPAVREDPRNPELYYGYVGGEFGMMRKHEAAVIAIEHYAANTTELSNKPNRGG
jgi:hypothetical protein